MNQLVTIHEGVKLHNPAAQFNLSFIAKDFGLSEGVVVAL